MSTKTNLNKKMPVVGHLNELRLRIVKALVAVLLAAVAIFLKSEAVIQWMSETAGGLVFISPHEAFLSRIKLGLFGGLALAMPVVMYQAGAFVWSGLETAERKALIGFGPFFIILFYLGAAFGLGVILPVAMEFLLGFASIALVPVISVDRYLSFAAMVVFTGGLAFELPVLILFLNRIGIVTPEFLRQKRPIAIVSVFVIAALLTPPDVITQILIAAPMLLLYEGSIWIIVWLNRKKGNS
jgi:sec-independent protein translocase protein TatC